MDTRRIRTSAIASLALMLMAACSSGVSTGLGGGGGGGGGGNGDAVTVGNNLFTPSALTVTVGTTVTWTWASGAVSHNVTFDDGVHSGTQSTGTFSRTFTTAGTYQYHCTIHGAAMSGTITVN